MKSNILSQFQSTLNELSEFGRGKDKNKRKGRGQGLTNALGGLGVKKIGGKTLNTDERKNKIATAGLAGAGIGSGIAAVGYRAKQKGLEKAAMRQGDIATGAMKIGDAGRKAYESGGKAKRGLRTALQNTIKEADNTAGAASKKAMKFLGKSKIAGKGKVGLGLAAGGLLAGAAVNALRNKKKKK